MAGEAAGGDLQGVVAEFVHVRAEVDGAGVRRLPRRPRDRAGQRPVDLDRGEVPLESPQVLPQARREVVPGDELPVQGCGGHVREDGPVGAVALPVAGAHSQRLAAAHDHLLDALAAVHAAAERLQPTHECAGEVGGSSDRDGPADLLAEHRHQPAEGGTAGGFRQQVGMQGAPGEQQSAARFGELLLGQSAYGQGHEARRWQKPGRAEPGCHRQSRFHGRKGSEEAAQQVRVQVFPQGREPLPGAGVVRAEGAPHLVPGRHGAAVESGAAAVGQRVGQHGGGVAPFQPVLLQLQGADRRRCLGQGVERAEQVADVFGVQVAVAADGSARLVLRLQDLDLPARVREHVRRHQAVRSGADHDRVRHLAPNQPQFPARVPREDNVQRRQRAAGPPVWAGHRGGKSAAHPRVKAVLPTGHRGALPSGFKIILNVGCVP